MPIVAQSQSTGRAPRASVSIDGTRVTDGIVSVKVHNNRYLQADTFEVEFALSAIEKQFPLDYWLSTDNILVDIAMGLPTDPLSADGFQSFITGYVDMGEITIGPNTVEITGRDFTSFMIDTKGLYGELNRSSSQIVESIAKANGLDVVATATSTPIKTLASQDTAFLTHQTSQWDVVTKLAQIEGFDAYVKGNTLYFQPANPSNTYAIQYVRPTADQIQQGNFESLKLTHRKALSGTTKIVVQSWDKKNNKFIQASASATVKGGSGSKSGIKGTLVRKRTADAAKITTYNVVRAGLNAQQAQQLADSTLANAILHERELSVDLPGDLDLDCHTMMLSLSGTESAADQDYYIDSVERRMSFQEGFRMVVRAKNHSPLTDTEEAPIEDTGAHAQDRNTNDVPDSTGTDTGSSNE